MKVSEDCSTNAINSSNVNKSKFSNLVKPSLVALAVAQSISMSSAQAATIHVGGTNGAGCGFTAAILSANSDATPSNSQCVAGSGDDVIELHRDITLHKAWRENVNGVQQDTAFGTPLITSNIIINGNGHTISRDSGAPNFGILSAGDDNRLELADIVLTNGANAADIPIPYVPQDSGRGVAIELGRGSLFLNDVTISNHTGGPAVDGFSISINRSTLTNNETALTSNGLINIIESSISNNSGLGIDALNPTSLNIVDSHIDSNGDGGIKTRPYFSGDGSGPIVIENSSVSNNSKTAIHAFNPEYIKIVDSEISNNTSASCAALRVISGYWGDSEVTIDGATISQNSATGYGGGICTIPNSVYGYILFAPSLNISNSSLTGNLAGGSGGAIYAGGYSSTASGTYLDNVGPILIPHSIVNSTISGNSAGNSGGAILIGGTANYNDSFHEGEHRLTLINSTVVDNSATYGGGIASTDLGKTNLSIYNSIIAGNSATVSGSEINHLSAISFPNEVLADTNNNVLGSSLESNFQAFNGFTPDASDSTATIDGSNPTMLEDIVDSLQDNGGATQTHALPAGSPSIDAGDLDTCLDDLVAALDQRGEARGEAGLCDIGAYEVQGTVGALPTINVDSIEVSEGDSNATFKISLSSPQTERIAVDFQTMDGTATDGLDYTGRVGTMTFAPGQTQKVRTIQLLDDNLGESTESFSLLLSNPVGATLGDSVGEVTITDDDGLPTISIEPADHSVNEGDSGNARRIVYTITLSSAQTEPVSVDYQTMDESAVGGVDYEIRSGSMTFMPGQTSKIRAIKVLGDTQTESDETFRLVLSNPSINAVIDANQANSTATIIDDDTSELPKVSMFAQDSHVNEGATTNRHINFEFVLSKTYSEKVTVDYKTRDITAVAGEDYVARSGTMTFMPGQTTKTRTIEVLDDALVEDDETFEVVISNPSNNSILDEDRSSDIGSIWDDERDVPVISIERAAHSVQEGDAGDSRNINFTITMAPALTEEVSFGFTTSDVTAAGTVDYERISKTITFQPGQTSLIQPIKIFGDTRVEANETFRVILGNQTSNVNIDVNGADSIGTILDDD
ncbi:hypothetical protein N9060_00425 [Arenicella sp.]|nr:hypothetical protein [Arenicella sp.]